MVRRRVLEMAPWVQVLACIVVAPLVEVGCILAFVACRLVVLVVEASWVVVACMLASLVVVACILVGLAYKMALVEEVLACTLEVLELVLAYTLEVLAYTLEVVACILEALACILEVLAYILEVLAPCMWWAWLELDTWVALVCYKMAWQLELGKMVWQVCKFVLEDYKLVLGELCKLV